jgi:hypothetical protein
VLTEKKAKVKIEDRLLINFGKLGRRQKSHKKISYFSPNDKYEKSFIPNAKLPQEICHLSTESSVFQNQIAAGQQPTQVSDFTTYIVLYKKS